MVVCRLGTESESASAEHGRPAQPRTSANETGGVDTTREPGHPVNGCQHDQDRQWHFPNRNLAQRERDNASRRAEAEARAKEAALAESTLSRAPALKRTALEERLRRRDCTASLLIMKSNGGVIGAATAARQAILEEYRYSFIDEGPYYLVTALQYGTITKAYVTQSGMPSSSSDPSHTLDLLQPTLPIPSNEAAARNVNVTPAP